MRQYLDEEHGRRFDPADQSTPESRLVDPDSPTWHVPSGREPFVRRARQRPSSSVRDLRAGDVGRFRADDFSVRSTDDKGHKESLSIPMPQQMLDELSAVCDSRVFPVRSSKALARVLIWEGLQTLHRIAKQDGLTIPHSHMQQLEALAKLSRDMQATLAYDTALEEASGLVRELRARGLRNRARTAAVEMLNTAKGIASREVRDRWVAQIEEEFGTLMRGRPAQVWPTQPKPTRDDPEHDHDPYEG